MRSLVSLFLGALGCVTFAACGGADGTQLFDDAGQPVKDATAQDTGGGTDGGNPDKDVTVEDAVVVDAVTVDVPVGPPDSKIHCGTASCSAQNQVCCATFGTTTTYACVASESACQGSDQVPISCSSNDNCASQGNSGFVCCASGQGPQNPNVNCQQFTTTAQVACQATCDANQGEFQVGCSVQTQNCIDTSQSCITSQCTLPGLTICR
jgi:hypothetical protein